MINFSINTFRCILTDDALLPPYKGSTFRGAFGVALKKVVCTLRKTECAVCLLSSRCLYARIFEPATWQIPTAHTVAPPHPYIIEPEPTPRTRYSAGNQFSFSLLLFGEFTDSLPYFIYAIESMGEVGIGKSMGDRRARFYVNEVTDGNGMTIYSSVTKRITSVPLVFSLSPPEAGTTMNGILSVELETPLRFKNDNRLTDKLTFQELIRAALRRVSGMHAAYGAGDPVLDYRDLVKEAASIRTTTSELIWQDWKRYSNRQQDAMIFGGINGNISFIGNIGPFIQIIEQAKIMHIGKQSTFGLGKFNYRWEPENS